MNVDDQHTKQLVDHGEVWETLNKTALLGTERSSAPFTATDTGVGGSRLSEGLSAVRSIAESTERHLLLAAATVDHYQRVGVSTQEITPDSAQGDPGLTPVGSEPPPCSAAATQILDMLLNSTLAVAGQQHELVALWATRCTGAGFAMAPRQLVALLQHATKHRFQHRGLTGSVAQVVGARGMLLADLNPEWGWVRDAALQLDSTSVAGSISAEVFDLTDSSLRTALLREWRERDPAAAREAVLVSWSSNKATERNEFVDAFQVGLSLDDEPFLERCLDDKAKGVRASAAHLLSCLPESAFAQRMGARVSSLLRVERSGLLRRQRVEIELPNEADVDTAWTRDGIDLASVPTGTGRRAWVLRQLTIAAPLEVWEQASSLTPPQLFAAMADSSLREELLDAWAFAASKQGNAAWADALCESMDPVTWQAAAALAPDDFNRHLQRLLNHATPTEVGVFNLLQSGSEKLNAASLDQIIEWIVTDAGHWNQSDAVVNAWFASATAAQMSSLLQRLDADDHRHKQIRHLEAARSIREAILKEFP